MSPRIEDAPMEEREFNSRPSWDRRFGLDGMTTHVELEMCFEGQKAYLELLEMMADFANDSGPRSAEKFREYVRTCVDNLRERRALEEHEARRGA